MNYALLVIAGAVIAFLLLGVVSVLMLRPTGAHRAEPAAPTAGSAADRLAWCPECTTSTLHTFHPNGTRTCGRCHHTTEGDM